MSLIEIQNLTHVYLPGTPYEKKALDGVTFSIEKGETVGVVGINGSGKSTLVQHLNGLLTPTSGRVLVGGRDTSLKENRSKMWKEVGLVFQFPEQQIFEISVEAEMAYGLKNMGLKPDEIKDRIHDALLKVGLEPTELLAMAPLRLSGGTRRRLALASILAMRPPVLVLDEPMAGLDASSVKYIINAISEMKREYETTVIMISHQASELLLMADKLAFLEEGRLVTYGDKKLVLQQMAGHDLQDIILPEHLQLVYRLAAAGYPVNPNVLTLEEVASEINKLFQDLKP